MPKKVQASALNCKFTSKAEQMDDLNDYLDLLEARARNKGKRTYTTDAVRKQLGLA